MTIDDFTQAESAAQFIPPKPARPKIALVLGSGLGAFADELERRRPHCLRADSVLPALHRDRTRWPARDRHTAGLAVAAMQGRTHLYEGYSAKEVSFPDSRVCEDGG